MSRVVDVLGVGVERRFERGSSRACDARRRSIARARWLKDSSARRRRTTTTTTTTNGARDGVMMTSGTRVRMVDARARRGFERARALRASDAEARLAARDGDGEDDGDAARRARAPKTEEEWDALTEWLSLCAMAPLTLLTFPQIWKNYVNAMAGDLAAIGAVSWQGYAAGMLGNLLLLSYFADKREPTATAAQAIGVTTSFMLITQIAWSGNVHNVAPIAMASASAFIVGGATLSVARYFNYAHGARGEKLWSMYQTALGVIGLTVTPQIISNALTPGLGWLPVELSVLGLVAAHRADKLPTKWSECSGWTATALFMSMPVAQIASNLHSPESLQGLSVLTSVFITGGNALMLSRAIFVKDLVWIAGSVWGAFVGGWGILATLFISHSPLTGERYITEVEFYTITVLLFSYTVIVIGSQLRSMLSHESSAESSIDASSR
jgi:hypothetical protein|tara:strand:+ start:287 stop:1606 length:1320 start_codon:yes stop_codon:yes gene_type:complete